MALGPCPCLSGAQMSTHRALQSAAAPSAAGQTKPPPLSACEHTRDGGIEMRWRTSHRLPEHHTAGQLTPTPTRDSWHHRPHIDMTTRQDENTGNENIYERIYVWAHGWVYVYLYEYMYEYMYEYVYEYIYDYMYEYMYEYMYKYMYEYMYEYMYKYK